MTLAVMGCIVNGPGESKAANIGISLPGTGEAPRCPVYIDGHKDVTLEGTYDELAAAFQKLVEQLRLHQIPTQDRGGGLRLRRGKRVLEFGVRLERLERSIA